MTAHPLDDLRRGKARPRAVCPYCGQFVRVGGLSHITYKDGETWQTAHLKCYRAAHPVEDDQSGR
jgi:hypothetical protein